MNVSLPEKTLRLLDRVAEKGDRSDFIDRAVHFYVKEVGRDRLKKQLRQGACARSVRDVALAEEWFFIEETC